MRSRQVATFLLLLHILAATYLSASCLVLSSASIYCIASSELVVAALYTDQVLTLDCVEGFEYGQPGRHCGHNATSPTG